MCLVERRGMDKPRITRSCYIPHSSLLSLPTSVGSQPDLRGLRRLDDRALHYNGEHSWLGEKHGLKAHTCPLVGVSRTVGVAFHKKNAKGFHNVSSLIPVVELLCTLSTLTATKTCYGHLRSTLPTNSVTKSLRFILARFNQYPSLPHLLNASCKSCHTVSPPFLSL
jgi:hypothetical protein